MTANLHVAWLTPGISKNYNRVLASQWIRCFQLVEPLRRHGITSHLRSGTRESQVVVFQRRQEEGDYLLAKKLKALGKMIIFDLSVNYLSSDPLPGRPYGSSSRHRDDCLRMLKVADAVTCSSSTIASKAKLFHENVYYLPDSINFAHFTGKFPHRVLPSGSEFKVVWNGVSPKLLELEKLFPVFAATKVGLVVISDRRRAVHDSLESAGVEYEFRKWRYQSFPDDLTRGNVAISFKDSDLEYERANSSFKILAPMAMGVPVIASPIPSYREALALGGGYTRATVEEFEACLRFLSANPDSLPSLGQQARSSAKKFDLEYVAEKFSKILRSVAG